MAEGATLALSDSCFVNNDLVGAGTVILQRQEDLVLSSGNFGTFDNGVDCKFMSIGGVCRDYESASCKADPTLSSLSAEESDGPEETSASALASRIERRLVISLVAAVALALPW